MSCTCIFRPCRCGMIGVPSSLLAGNSSSEDLAAANRRVQELEEKAAYHERGHRSANEALAERVAMHDEALRRMFAARRFARRWKALAKSLWQRWRDSLAAERECIADHNADRARLAQAEALLNEAREWVESGPVERRIDAYFAGQAAPEREGRENGG